MSDVNAIHEKLLGEISDSYQKTEGYPTYDLTRAVAFGLLQQADALSKAVSKLDVDNLKDDELTRFVRQRKGIYRKQATKATGTLSITGNGTVNIGGLFESQGGVQFSATETVNITGSGTVFIEATTAGAVGNVGACAITEIPVTIAGIVAVTNLQPTAGGYDEESDDSLKSRYYEALQRPPTSGNIYHYMAWAKEISGVGAIKVFPLEKGANTVTVTIIDSNMQQAFPQLVEKMQSYIDPNPRGTGAGQAPIGAYCSVESASGLTVNITVSVVLVSGYALADVQTAVSNNIKAYLATIAFKQDYVSYAKIGSAINDTDGIADYSNLRVNGMTGNISLTAKQVAILGSVVLSE